MLERVDLGEQSAFERFGFGGDPGFRQQEFPHPLQRRIRDDWRRWLDRQGLGPEELRRKHPILVIDTYWTASGEAFCPAAMGLGYHIGPQGSIEICPALSFATEKVQDNGGDLHKTFNESQFLRGFTKFVKERTKGCVILEKPQELHSYIKECGAKDFDKHFVFAVYRSCYLNGSIL